MESAGREEGRKTIKLLFIMATSTRTRLEKRKQKKQTNYTFILIATVLAIGAAVFYFTRGFNADRGKLITNPLMEDAYTKI